MARPRIPSAIHLAQGKMQPGTPNAARFEKQGRGNEPVPPAPISAEVPAHMNCTEAQQVLWKRILEIIPQGVAGSSDEIALQALVVLWSKLNDGTIVAVEWSQLRGLLVQFGMTPAART